MSFGVTFWITVGFVLIIAEIFSLNLVLLFFGLSALVVALAKSLGLANLTAEIILFALAGLGSLLFFRKKLKKGLASRRELSIDLNAAVVVAHDMDCRQRIGFATEKRDKGLYPRDGRGQIGSQGRTPPSPGREEG